MRVIRSGSDKYLHSGIIILAISGASSLFLNFEGVRCLSAINSNSGIEYSEQVLAELERNCFVITNSYVYSLFGVVAGIILIAIWVKNKMKARRDR